MSTNTSSSSTPLHFKTYGSGPVLLMIHGLMVTGEIFNPIIDHFSNHYQVIVPDLRGHGNSGKLPPPYAVDQLAADLLQLLDYLKVDVANVVGYSQGGAVAQQFVLDYPKRCSRLILICSYAANMVSLKEKIEGYITPLLLRALGMKRFANVVVSKGMKQLDVRQATDVMEMMAGQDQRLMLLAWKEVMRYDNRHRLGEIKCPTMIIAGSKDVSVPVRHAQTLHDGIGGSQLMIIEGGTHALIWTQHHEYLKAVDQFLIGDK